MCQYTSIGVKIKEEDKEVMLMCTLPKSWDQLVTTISYRTTKYLEFDSIWDLCCLRRCGGVPI